MEDAGFDLDKSAAGGIFLWARLPGVEDSDVLVRRSIGDGIVLAPGRLFRANRESSPWLRFNIASLQNAKVLESIPRYADDP